MGHVGGSSVVWVRLVLATLRVSLKLVEEVLDHVGRVGVGQMKTIQRLLRFQVESHIVSHRGRVLLATPWGRMDIKSLYISPWGYIVGP